MATIVDQKLTLDEFLQLSNLEESPAWEFLDGYAIQKPMPKFRHSILQKRLLEVVTEPSHYLTLPELRCTFGGRSIVPDVAVVALHRVALNQRGEPEDDFRHAPDWAIEILSPDQSPNRVIDNLLHCLHHGTHLGWLVDPQDYSVLVINPQQRMKVFRHQEPLKVLPDFKLELTAAEIFGWLQLRS